MEATNIGKMLPGYLSLVRTPGCFMVVIILHYRTKISADKIFGRKPDFRLKYFLKNPRFLINKKRNFGNLPPVPLLRRRIQTQLNIQKMLRGPFLQKNKGAKIILSVEKTPKVILRHKEIRIISRKNLNNEGQVKTLSCFSKNGSSYFPARSITLTACANDESNNRIQPNCPKNNEEILIINATYGRMVNNEYCGGGDGGGGGGVTNCRSPVGKLPLLPYVSKHRFVE